MQEGHYCEHGEDAYSYATCIRTRKDNGTWVYNLTKYSTTTSRHQSKCFGDVDCWPADLIIVRDAPRGVDAQWLRDYTRTAGAA